MKSTRPTSCSDLLGLAATTIPEEDKTYFLPSGTILLPYQENRRNSTILPGLSESRRLLANVREPCWQMRRRQGFFISPKAVTADNFYSYKLYGWRVFLQ